MYATNGARAGPACTVSNKKERLWREPAPGTTLHMYYQRDKLAKIPRKMGLKLIQHFVTLSLSLIISNARGSTHSNRQRCFITFLP
jgi:hypothetical protein